MTENSRRRFHGKESSPLEAHKETIENKFISFSFCVSWCVHLNPLITAYAMTTDHWITNLGFNAELEG